MPPTQAHQPAPLPALRSSSDRATGASITGLAPCGPPRLRELLLALALEGSFFSVDKDIGDDPADLAVQGFDACALLHQQLGSGWRQVRRPQSRSRN